jgi:hypothetical protein
LGLVGSTKFLRLSSRKAADASIDGAAYRKSGSFAFFAKGGIPRISIPTVAYPTLCKERKGWGTRCFAALPAVFPGFVQGDGGLYLAPAKDAVMGFVTTIVRSIEEQPYAA